MFTKTKEFFGDLKTNCEDRSSGVSVHHEVWKDITPFGKCTIGVPLIILCYIFVTVLILAAMIVIPLDDIATELRRRLAKLGNRFPVLNKKIDLGSIFFRR